MATYSISVRLQRVTIEECYVSAPVTVAVLADGLGEDGQRHVDGRKLADEAIAMAGETSHWLIEERKITVHPIQKAPDFER